MDTTEVETLDAALAGEILEAVAAFADGVIGPATARPEAPPSPEQVDAIVEEAAELGILGDSGAGLWEAPRLPASVALSHRALARLATRSAGIALQLHTLALGRVLCRRLGLAPSGRAIPLLPTPTDLPIPDRAPAESGFVQAAGWDALLVPGAEAEPGHLGWALYGADTLDREVVPDSHGLEETRTWAVRIPADVEPAARATSEATLLFEALGMEALGLVAIGLGSCRDALARARTYASERRQGGQLLREHPAIQLLLGRCRANIDAVAALLDHVETAPTTPAALCTALGLRSVAHPLLCEAATDALQVLGGYGYMRDYGMERALRDNQHLKLRAGPPDTLRLFLGLREVSR